MYGTVARFKIKPGMENKLQDQIKEYESISVDGYQGTSIYKLDNSPNEYFMVVAFRDKDSYFKNAEDPAQDERFKRMMEVLDGEPQWNDGEVIYSGPWNQ